MTGKERYQERRRLEAERRLHAEQGAARGRLRDEEVEDMMFDVLNSLSRIAGALEALATQEPGHGDRATGGEDA